MRKKISFTSDLHLGHANSIVFDKRPFKDLKEMHSSLVRRFNSVVPKFGLTYFLGDMMMPKSQEVKDVLSKLNGTKILILGNHDRGHNSMYDLGFDCVMDGGSLLIAGEIVTMSHYPLGGLFREDITGMRGAVEGDNWHGESKHRKKRGVIENAGQFHLHGHVHSPNGGRSEKILGRQYDVGVVANKYTPVSMSTIESWIAITKREELDNK